MVREMRPVVDPAEAGFLIGDEQRCPRLCPAGCDIVRAVVTRIMDVSVLIASIRNAPENCILFLRQVNPRRSLDSRMGSLLSP